MDIETSPDPRWAAEGEKAFDANGKLKFPPLPYHIPEVIVWLCTENSTGELTLNSYDLAETDERLVLELLATDIRSSQRMVSWNGRTFDMPLLNLRAMLKRVDWSFWIEKRFRFENYKRKLYHYDMIEQLGNYGSARSLSLDRVGMLLGLQGKNIMHGDEVADTLKTDRKKVVRYCVSDVCQTFLVYLLFCGTHLGAGEKAFQQFDKIKGALIEKGYLKE